MLIHSANVIITDLQSCLELMEKNICDNKAAMRGKIQAKVLEWYLTLERINIIIHCVVSFIFAYIIGVSQLRDSTLLIIYSWQMWSIMKKYVTHRLNDPTHARLYFNVQKCCKMSQSSCYKIHLPE